MCLGNCLDSSELVRGVFVVNAEESCRIPQWATCCTLPCLQRHRHGESNIGRRYLYVQDICDEVDTPVVGIPLVVYQKPNGAPLSV